MRYRQYTAGLALVAALAGAPAAAGRQQAPAIPAKYEAVLAALGKTGDFKDNVLKVNIPRTDLTVTIKGRRAPTPFGFGGWVALEAGSGGEVLMGDLVLTEDEVNPVMSALLDNGLEVTALHNHFFWEQPRIFYMHVHGQGTPADLARKLKPAVDLIGKGSGRAAGPPAAPSAAPSAKMDTATLAKIVGTEGEQSGEVYKITIGRDDLKLTEMGASINARMGLNTWAAFVGTDQNAAIAGDVAMLASEVMPLLKALRAAKSANRDLQADVIIAPLARRGQQQRRKPCGGFHWPS